MGAYLSEPVTEKVSTDGKCKRLSYGASSMQGWRVTQEDAHNCLPDYDENTSLFAVYDGHGGAEVAKYCSLHLPDFLHSLSQYKNNNIAQSLEDAFIEFDTLLTKSDVISELKQLAGSSEASEEDDTEVLNEEAEMPLEELLARYKTGGAPLKSVINQEHLHNDKPKSPMLRAKQDSKQKNVSKESSDHNIKDEKSDSDVLVNGENEVKCDEMLKKIIKDKVKKCDVEDEADNKDMEKDSSAQKESNELESNKDTEIKPETDEEKHSSKEKNEESIKKEKSEKLECDDLEKESTSNNSRSSKKRCPLFDSEDSDSSDDDYGESDSSSENSDEDEWNENDNDDEEDDEEDEDEDEKFRERFESRDFFSIGEKEEPGSDSGCTAVLAIVCGTQLYVANAGDSRCVVSRHGKAIEMSSDHKPEDETERKRIEKAGGQVTTDGRVNGGLNLSRAIGDHSYKQNTNLSSREQMITAFPDVRTLTLNTDGDEFMVLACDGIWNYMSSQEVIDFIKKRLNSTTELSAICEELFDYCLAPNTLGDGTGCDNMTCIIVKFHTLDSTEDKESLKRSHSPVHDNPDKEKKRKIEEESS